MAYTTINKSSSFQNQLLWDGTGATNARTGLGFQPDFCWGKERSSTSGHILQDSVQGLSVYLSSNNDSGTNPTSVQFTSFDSDGFTLGTSTGINQSGQTNVGWAWKAGTTSGLSGGTITPSAYSYNATSGFGIYQYTGTGSAGTIAHGLGKIPKMIIIKATSTTGNWTTYHAGSGNTKSIVLNTNAADYTSTNWDSTTPTNSVFYLRAGGDVNTSGVTYLAYVFTDVTGYSKFGSYSGNSDANGAFVYTGFKPAFLILKRTDSADWWGMYDNARNPSNVVGERIYVNESDAGADVTNVDFLSNGFKLRVTDGAINDSSGSYIYIAFGQSLVGSNNVPCTAR